MVDASWVIAAIASLVGTLVGGFATYWTSNKSLERSLASEQRVQRNTLLREAAARFVTAVTDTPLLRDGLARVGDEWKSAAARLAAATTDEEFIDAARAIDPDIRPGMDHTAMLVDLLRSTRSFDQDVTRAAALLTEIRLIAPSDVAEAAQRVLSSAAARELALAVAPGVQRQATDSFNRDVNDFFNRVRRQMDVEDIEFDLFNHDVVKGVLKSDLRPAGPSPAADRAMR